MADILKSFTFFDNGNNNRKKENFQNFLFDGINMEEKTKHISFYRSDFRGTKFQKTKFYNNDFSRADLIDCLLVETEFLNCKFYYTEIYNTYFEQSGFINTEVKLASFIKLIFRNCIFDNSSFAGNTLRELKFKNCTIKNCGFKNNSGDEIIFEKTYFENIDFSNMTALNFFFDDCKFDNIQIDADYLGSYFFKGAPYNKIKLKYRGKLFDFDVSQNDLFNNLFKIYFENNRFYEAINIIVQKNNLENNTISIFPLLTTAIEKILIEPNELKRIYQFKKTFVLLEFYFDSEYISIGDYFRLSGYLKKLELANFNLIEQIEFKEIINRLQTIIQNTNIFRFLSEASNVYEKILLEIKIDELNKEKFERYFSKTMEIFGEKFGNKSKIYQVIEIRKGSLIYDIIIYSSAGLFLFKILLSALKIARSAMHEAVNIIIDYRLNQRALTIAKNINSKSQLKEIKNIKEFQSMSKMALTANPENEIKEIKNLLPLIKSAIIYPNALTQTKN
jgi:uncharacterized protein YjbI with pentapeptide repeats